MIQYVTLMLYAIHSCNSLQTDGDLYDKLEANETAKLKFLQCNSFKKSESKQHCAMLCYFDSSCIAFDFELPVCILCNSAFNSTPHQIQGTLYVLQGPEGPTSGEIYIFYCYLSYNHLFGAKTTLKQFPDCYHILFLHVAQNIF